MNFIAGKCARKRRFPNKGLEKYGVVSSTDESYDTVAKKAITKKLENWDS